MVKHLRAPTIFRVTVPIVDVVFAKMVPNNAMVRRYKPVIPVNGTAVLHALNQPVAWRPVVAVFVAIPAIPVIQTTAQFAVRMLRME